MKLLFRIKKNHPWPPEWLAWWIKQGLSITGCHLWNLPALPFPMARALLCPIVQSSHTSSFRSSTSNVFLSSSFRIVAFSSAILFWFLRKSCSLATTQYSYWFFSKYMLGKRILKKTHTTQPKLSSSTNYIYGFLQYWTCWQICIGGRKKVSGLGDTLIENFQLFKKIKRKQWNRYWFFFMMGKKRQKEKNTLIFIAFS